MDLFRTWLFVPGHKEKMVQKSLGLDTDVIMLDIEDGVPHAEKNLARKFITQALESDVNSIGPSRFVRINAIGQQNMEIDLQTIIQPGIHGLVLPKVESVEDIMVVEKILDDTEPQSNIEKGNTKFLIAIESPKGLHQATAIASCSDRIIGLMFGAEDFGLEMGLPLVREGEARELIYARSALTLASASANVQSIDGVWPNISDENGLWSDTKQARQLGFTGKSLIHPSQIKAINTTFSPSSEEIAHCEEVIKAFDKATANGEGSIAFGGQLIDLPIVERARRTLTLSKRI